MIPQVFWLGPIPVNSFGLMIALSFFATIYLLAKSFERNGIEPRHAEQFVFLGGFSGLLGARLLYIWTFWKPGETPLSELIFSSSGFVFYGGFILAALVVIGYAKRNGIRLAPFLDSVGPCLALGYAIGRLGCQLSGDGDYGVATTSFWGMAYDTGVVPTAPGVRVYPTPFFESTICLGILCLLLRAEVSLFWSSRPYSRFGLYLSCIAIERFFIEFIRVEPKYQFGFSQAQWTSIVLFGLGGVLILVSSMRTAAAGVGKDHLQK